MAVYVHIILCTKFFSIAVVPNWYAAVSREPLDVLFSVIGANRIYLLEDSKMKT